MEGRFLCGHATYESNATLCTLRLNTDLKLGCSRRRHPHFQPEPLSGVALVCELAQSRLHTGMAGK